jgi:hypothetical protein
LQLLLCLFVAFLPGAPALSAAQTVFSSPENAADALLAAVETRDYETFLSVAGPEMATFWSSGDPVRDAIQLDRLVDAAHSNGCHARGNADGRMMLYIGGIALPFPAPLVRTDGGWRFDGVAGSIEVAARRIRRNEEAVVELCSRLRESEFAYRENSPGQIFAGSIRSTPGNKDGLFWAAGDGDESPLGPAFAHAAYMERRPGEDAKPLFGYYLRILPAHSASTRDNFAFVAWPAEYQITGVRSFLITDRGEIYQRDLGPAGARIAQTVTLASLSHGWRPVETTAMVLPGEN